MEMDMSAFWKSIQSWLTPDVQRALYALLALVVGYVLARLLSRFAPRLLRRTALDDRLARWFKIEQGAIERRLRFVSFWLVMLLGIGVAWQIARRIPLVSDWFDIAGEFLATAYSNSIVVFVLNLLMVAAATWLLAFALRRVKRWWMRLLELAKTDWSERIRPLKFQKLVLLSTPRIARLAQTLIRYSRYVVILLLLLVYLSVVFSIFPQTRGVVTSLLDILLGALGDGWEAFISYLPKLLNLAIVILITYYALKLIHFFFGAIAKGTISFRNFYPEWAEPTYQIVRVLVIALAIVAAFPYIPGSDSPAFQGITIFMGALFSLGSTSVVANIVAGLVLTYTRAFKIGDRVQIADTIGDVTERTLLVTRVRTIKNVDITIPNSMVLSSHIINYSALSLEKRLILPATVTIGYDSPWRDVHTALIRAAQSTPGILPEPKPFVLQTSLDDFYVSYELNAYTDQPNQMAVIYSDLHQNIQDSFNEAGIEIMSPHYSALRDGNRTTVPEDYLPKKYRPPSFRVKDEE
jgi:small-conductance mechanosensitive channel